VEKVVRQLRKSPSGFRVLDCVGWFQDDLHSRCGILYEMPIDLSPSPAQANSLKVVMLSNLLESGRGKPKPSLGDRFALAKILANAMLEFHMSPWLHKNFNAENVVFFLPNDATECLAPIQSPYIASFDLSRPDHDALVSELVPTSSDSLDFAYHHPVYQYPRAGQMRDSTTVSRYHRAFDVYSLGCVLLEIGVWKSLRSFGWNDRYRRVAVAWRSFLQNWTKDDMALIAASTYADTVSTCLKSNVIGSDPKAESERVRDFCWGIVRKLDSLRV
jgi:hypothetical protein